MSWRDRARPTVDDLPRFRDATVNPGQVQLVSIEDSCGSDYFNFRRDRLGLPGSPIRSRDMHDLPSNQSPENAR